MSTNATAIPSGSVIAISGGYAVVADADSPEQVIGIAATSTSAVGVQTISVAAVGKTTNVRCETTVAAGDEVFLSEVPGKVVDAGGAGLPTDNGQFLQRVGYAETSGAGGTCTVLIQIGERVEL
jgi:hypothetical protein